MPISTTCQEWRCRCCGALLGIADEDRIELRHKAALYRVRGEVTTHCRRCGTPSQFTTRNLNSFAKPKPDGT